MQNMHPDSISANYASGMPATLPTPTQQPSNAGATTFANAIKQVMEALSRRVETIERNRQVHANESGSMKSARLIDAAQRGDVGAIDLLLENGANSRRKKFGWNAFLFAADKGHTAAVERLLKADAGLLDTFTNFGRNALMVAVREPHIETTSLLLSKGIDANCRDEDKKTALIIATENNNIDAVKLLLPVTRDSLNAVTKNECNTALTIAASSGHIQIMRLLLDADGINIGIKNAAGNTPMKIAKKRKNKEVECLLQAHVNRLRGTLPPARANSIHQLSFRLYFAWQQLMTSRR